MNENDINDLLNSVLGGNTIRTDFKNQLLQNSTAAFTRSKLFRKRLKVTGLILLIAIITTTAFFSGRISANKNSYNQQQIVQQTKSEKNISVPRDLITWLDAAKFFDQIGMSERAEFSYKQASMLLPVDLPENNIADFGRNNALALQTEKSYKTDSKYYSNKINRILAQHFGE